MHRTRNKLLNILADLYAYKISIQIFKMIIRYSSSFLVVLPFPTFIPKQIISTEFYAILNGNKNYVSRNNRSYLSNRIRQDGTLLGDSKFLSVSI